MIIDVPKSSKIKGTVVQVMELCEKPNTNKALLQSYLSRALSHYHRKNFYLQVALFAKRGSYRLIFIDPTNNMVLWLRPKERKLYWFPLYNLKQPSIV